MITKKTGHGNESMPRIGNNSCVRNYFLFNNASNAVPINSIEDGSGTQRASKSIPVMRASPPWAGPMAIPASISMLTHLG